MASPGRGPGAGDALEKLRFQDFFIVHEGRPGIFLPLGKDGELLPDQGDREVEALRRELARLAEENLRLKKEIAEREAPPRSPDDFAAALQGAVDSLQGRLSSLDNPVSNFAVKELRLESQVRVDVNALGQIEYRFPQPGACDDPCSLSRLTLDLVPLPKPAADGSPAASTDLSSLGLDSIAGLGQEARRVLHENRIFTVHDFLSVGTRVRSRIELRRLLGEERERLGGWLVQAELLRVPGLGAEAARALVESGFRGLADLAASMPEAVLAACRAKGKPALDAARAAEWIKAAQSLEAR